VNFSLFIAKRYLFSKSSNNAINIITIIAAIGVVVGAMSLFIVLSGFSGLKDFSLQFTNFFDSDLKIYPSKGKTIDFTTAQKQQLKKIEGIESFSEIIEERVFLHYKGKNHISYIKGVDENYGKVTVVDSIMLAGNWFEPQEHQVVIGLTTSAKLSLSLWDYSDLLEIIVPKPGTGQINTMDPTQAFTMEKVVVSGVYQVNEDLDGKYVFTDIAFARNLLSLDESQLSSIEIKMKPNASEKELRAEIERIFPDGIDIKNRIQQNDALYKMLNTENIAVYLIFTLVLIIALFNVIGSIIMMILDKRKNIKTLYSLGAPLKGIRKIFFLQGALMTFLGGLLGIIIGVIAVTLQLKFGLINITSTLPYPVKMEFINILIVFVTINVLGIIASKIASSRVREKLVT
jgi:lipoprotein-releasing system permease protein